MKEKLNLLDLTINNETYNQLINQFEERLKVAINYISREDFIMEELARIQDEYLQSPKVTAESGTILKTIFDGGIYTRLAYNSLKAGHNRSIGDIIRNALQQRNFTVIPGDEQVYINSINFHLERGAAYLLYEQYLKGQTNKQKMEIEVMEKVMITYSWDDEEHQLKVIALTDYLRKNGFLAVVDVKLAQEECAIDFTKMMHKSLYECSKVVIVLSSGYKRKADAFIGGVGEEYRIILKDIEQNPNKYILVSFEKMKREIIPMGFASREMIDISEETGMHKLYYKLLGKQEFTFSEVSKNTPVIKQKNILSFDELMWKRSEPNRASASSPLTDFKILENSVINGNRSQFLESRRLDIEFRRMPIEFEFTGRIALHLMPAASLITPEKDCDLIQIQTKNRLVKEINGKSTTPRVDFWGWLASPLSPGPEKYNYVRVFRNGIIEAVNGELFYPYQGQLRIPVSGPFNYELAVVKAIQEYLNFYKNLNIELPIFLSLSFFGVKNYFIASEKLRNSGQKDKIPVNAIYEDMVLVTFEQDIPKTLKPIFDRIWNACGYDGSFNYQNDGKWRPVD